MISTYMKERMERKLGIKPPLQTKADPKPIPKKSAKRVKEEKVLKKISDEMRSEKDECEIRSPVCSGKMDSADHLQKRSPKNLTVRENLKRSCNKCQIFKEENPKWAEENGHSISRFAKLEIHDTVDGKKVTLIDKV